MRTLTIFFYSVFASMIFSFARIFKRLNPRLEFQFKDRLPPCDIVQKFAHKRSQYSDSVLFFCSSAGEYEQAKPLIAKYESSLDTYILIVFHSQSGYDFAKVRGEENDFCLAPADTVWSWGSLFAAARPRLTFVIRYELWPAFLETAAKYSTLYLVNASAPQEESNNRLKKSLQLILLAYFKKIFVVDETESTRFSVNFRLPANKIVVSGDTKYDRVMQLAQRESNLKIIASIREIYKDKSILVLGSCYKEDILLLTNAIQENPALLSSNWHICLVPHELDSANIKWIESHLKEQNLSFSFIDNPEPDTPITVVDKVGLLTKIYSIADLAWVGGALHNRVHNVLEPASYGVPLAFGPHYHTSHEAIKLVESDKADVILDAEKFSQWWSSHSEKNPAYKNEILQYMTGLCGATSTIVKEV